MLDYGADEGYVNIFLEVRVGNEAAIGLYESAGFEKIGMRADYYNNPREDALIMELVFDEEE